MNKWISCSERLPNIGEKVIVHDICGDSFIGRRIAADKFEGDDIISTADAWMPIARCDEEGK